jgi:hypothetical protein
MFRYVLPVCLACQIAQFLSSNGFGFGYEVDAEAVELLEDVDELARGAGEAVVAPDQQDVELPPMRPRAAASSIRADKVPIGALKPVSNLSALPPSMRKAATKTVVWAIGGAIISAMLLYALTHFGFLAHYGPGGEHEDLPVIVLATFLVFVFLGARYVANIETMGHLLWILAIPFLTFFYVLIRSLG